MYIPFLIYIVKYAIGIINNLHNRIDIYPSIRLTFFNGFRFFTFASWTSQKQANEIIREVDRKIDVKIPGKSIIFVLKEFSTKSKLDKMSTCKYESAWWPIRQERITISRDRREYSEVSTRFVRCRPSNYVFPRWSKSPFSIRATILAPPPVETHFDGIRAGSSGTSCIARP